jgi:predicted secreted protein
VSVIIAAVLLSLSLSLIISSPIQPKHPRDYSQISTTWWEKKREEKRQLGEELTKLQGRGGGG